MMKILAFFLFVVVGLFFSTEKSSAKPQLNKSFRPQWAENLFEYKSYTSISNYDSTGRMVNLPGTQSFWNTAGFDYSGRYVFSPTFALHGGLRYHQAEANVGNTTQYQGGFQSFNLGLEYKINSSFADFILEGVSEFSLFRPDLNSTKPLYGDGAHSFGGNLWILQQLGPIYWHGKAGLLFRTEGLSGLAPYQLGLHWRLGSWTFSSIIDGSTTLMPDTEGETKRRNYLNRSSVGSLNYRSANPTVAFLDLQAKWFLTNQFGILGGMGKTFMGRNASNGIRYFVAVDIHWQTKELVMEKNPLKNTMPSKSPPPRDNPEDSPGFFPISL